MAFTKASTTLWRHIVQQANILYWQCWHSHNLSFHSRCLCGTLTTSISTQGIYWHFHDLCWKYQCLYNIARPFLAFSLYPLPLQVAFTSTVTVWTIPLLQASFHSHGLNWDSYWLYLRFHGLLYTLTLSTGTLSFLIRTFTAVTKMSLHKRYSIYRSLEEPSKPL